VPFVVEFEFGINSEGYWCYDRMVLQLEDCVDVLKNVYPEFDFLFLFDHSCGHDKQRPDGLNAENMAKYYGGKQSFIRPSIITQEKGYLGLYQRTLNAGDTQYFVFQPDDSGPFWLSEQQREELRNDKEIAGQTLKRNFTKAELTAKLREKEIMATGSLKALKKLCDQNQVPTAEFIQKIKQRWVGKQKGLLQILWERGWIDIASLGKYTIEGSLDGFGIKRYDTSLKHLMANCVDFEEEESLLRSIGTKMGVIVDRTPKCHCELAGEGVEYSWGCAKNEYRRKPLSLKRKKETWRQTVRGSVCQEKS